MAAIELSKVTKRFGTVVALDEVSLTIQPNEFVSLIGPSGCGKTTLLRVAANLERPTSGEVWINDDPPSAACRAHHVGVAFQRPALVPWRTALGNVELTLEVTGREGSLSPQKLLTEFGLAGFESHYPHQLSGGMQQRVNIAAAMVHNPPVLLMDEPFGALDEFTREQMAEWLGKVLVHSPKTVLFVTHSVEEAVVLSDKVVVMSARPGKIDSVFPIELNSRPRPKEVRLSTDFKKQTDQIRQRLYELANGGTQ